MIVKAIEFVWSENASSQMPTSHHLPKLNNQQINKGHSLNRLHLSQIQHL